MHVFFVHTPFQILVAQSIILQENLNNNILILSHTGVNARHFYDIIKNLASTSLWQKTIILGDLSVFSNVKTMVFELPKYVFKMAKILSGHSEFSLYFGDVNHPLYYFLALKYSRRKKKIAFFEEGLSHYSRNPPEFKQNWVNWSKHFFLDKLIFNPLGVNDFSKYLYDRKNNSFPIYNQTYYSIIPTKKEIGYKPLKFKVIESNALSKELSKIKTQLSKYTGSEFVLYLSTTSYDLFKEKISKGEIIQEALSRLNLTKVLLLVKFHPKESKEEKNLFTQELENNKIPYLVIMENTSFPTEVLFNQISIHTILAYDTSSLFYARAFNIPADLYSLIPLIIDDLKNKGLTNTYAITVYQRINNTFYYLFKNNLRRLEVA